MLDIQTTYDEDAGILSMRANLSAPLENIWRVWAERDLMAAWWHRHRSAFEILEYDFTEGGAFVYKADDGDGRGEHLVNAYFATVNEAHSEIRYVVTSPAGTDGQLAAAGAVDCTVKMTEVLGSTQLLFVMTFREPGSVRRLLSGGTVAALAQVFSTLDESAAALANRKQPQGRGAGQRS